MDGASEHQRTGLIPLLYLAIFAIAPRLSFKDVCIHRISMSVHIPELVRNEFLVNGC